MATSIKYFEGVMLWMLAGDILVSTSLFDSSKYLNEIPLSDALDSFAIEQPNGQRALVEGYSF